MILTRKLLDSYSTIFLSLSVVLRRMDQLLLSVCGTCNIAVPCDIILTRRPNTQHMVVFVFSTSLNTPVLFFPRTYGSIDCVLYFSLCVCVFDFIAQHVEKRYTY